MNASALHFEYSGQLLLSNLVGWDPVQLKAAQDEQCDYRTVCIPKRNGSKRILCVPPPLVKEFQYLFLKLFLYRLYRRKKLARNIMGFLPGKSIYFNAWRHAVHGMEEVIHLDLQDAFPSVTKEAIKNALRYYLNKELALYRKYAEYNKTAKKRFKTSSPQPAFFSNKRVGWFRWLSRSDDPKHLSKAQCFLDDCIELAADLLTYQGKLPQGSPASPFLLNLVISHTRLLQNLEQKVKTFDKHCRITIYADDLTISTSKDMRPHIGELVAVIEKQGLFKVNKAKTRCYSVRHEAPQVTGIKVTTRLFNNDEMKEYSGVIKGVMRRGRLGGYWTIRKIALSKALIKKIRGLIHAACYDSSLDQQVEGYVNYVHSIYPTRIPNQIYIPYKKYRYLKMLEKQGISEEQYQKNRAAYNEWRAEDPEYIPF